MVEVQQNHINGAALRFKEQPWCGKHVSSQGQATAKNVYNYAVKNRNVDKTPMCRIAELARFHKLKHEYVLLDESGPAHKKQFTVKLVLKQGEEYEGSGPSIKKAQQSAAENALQKTQLQMPPQRKQVKSKNETNPVYLLYSVASQLGLTVKFEEQVEMMPFNKNFIPPPSYPVFMNGQQNGGNPIFCNNFGPSTNNQNRPELVCGPPWAIMNPESSQNFPPKAQFQKQSINGPALINCNPNSIQLMARVPPPPPPNKLNTPPPLIPFHTTPLAPQQPNVYKSCFLLSDGSEHHGQGRTVVAAKIDAALNALFHLRPLLSKMEAQLKDEQKTNIDLESIEKEVREENQNEENRNEENQNEENQNEENSMSLSDEEEDEDDDDDLKDEMNGDEKEGSESPSSDKPKQRRSKPKSVVSQIHECAYRLKLNVEFEIVSETGEPHNRRYVMSCTLSSPNSQQAPIVAMGKGSSKKAAKQNACQIMLDQIEGMNNDALYLAHVIVKQTTKKNIQNINGNKESKRKTIIKDIKKDPQYGQQINPISRLIQVMQSRKENEPVFRLIGERGQNRYREFVVQVTCVGQTKIGVGPNKKLAKRAAAVAMLEQIGYVKPMPQPGKSLLKKRSSDSLQAQVEIGVFDPNELSSSTSQPQKVHQMSPEPETQSFCPDQIPAELQNSSIETFADIDTALAKDVSQLRFSSDSMSPPIVAEQMRIRCESENQADPQPMRLQKRRVTFSNQVSSCPPPEDVNYPDATIAPLKSEVVLVTKLKKRGRDSKKALTSEEKFQIASTCRLFCQLPNGRQLRSGYLVNDATAPISPENDYLDFGQSSSISPIQPPSTPNAEFQSISPASSKMQQHPLAIATPIIPSNTPITMDLISPSQLPMQDLAVKDSKFCLERLAKQFRFTVSYSDFPKAADEYFSLVTIGLDKPILCHGCGASEEQAHNDAAYNAIAHLSTIDAPKPPQN